MHDHPVDILTDKDTWESRQKHASFFQNQLGSWQQSAIASLSLTTNIIVIGFFMTRLLGHSNLNIFHCIIAVVFAWLMLMITLAIRFMQSALRIEREYHDEHRKFFPGTSRYRLESYLLPTSRSERWPFKSKKEDAAANTTNASRKACCSNANAEGRSIA